MRRGAHQLDDRAVISPGEPQMPRDLGRNRVGSADGAQRDGQRLVQPSTTRLWKVGVRRIAQQRVAVAHTPAAGDEQALSIAADRGLSAASSMPSASSSRRVRSRPATAAKCASNCALPVRGPSAGAHDAAQAGRGIALAARQRSRPLDDEQRVAFRGATASLEVAVGSEVGDVARERSSEAVSSWAQVGASSQTKAPRAVGAAPASRPHGRGVEAGDGR